MAALLALATTPLYTEVLAGTEEDSMSPGNPHRV